MLQYLEKLAKKSGYDIRLEKDKKKYKLFFITGKNRIGILYKISAAMYVENWNIIEMNAFTNENGVVEDCFLIEPMVKRLPYIMEYTLLSTIDRLLKSDLTVVNYISKHSGKWKALQNRKGHPAGVLIVKENTDDVYDIIMETEDRPGLIFEITQVLYRFYFDIKKMESVTIDGRAHDKIQVVRDSDKKSKSDGKILREALDKIVT